MQRLGTHVSPVGQHKLVPISATGTAVPVGGCVGTTSATTITAGAGVVVAPASMNGISAGMRLNFAGGTGAAEDVIVTAINPAAGTFTATFVNNHSGAYNITSYRGSFVGKLTVNQAGTGVTITLYNGSPNLSPQPTGAGVFAVITPVAGATLFYDGVVDYGLYYTAAGTMGNYTLSYTDQAV